jgi:disulfide bond formation protein DsbB
MKVVKKILHLPPLINFGLGVGLIVGAYIFEIFGYYDPCPLCVLQRWSFALIALCGALMRQRNCWQANLFTKSSV